MGRLITLTACAIVAASSFAEAQTQTGRSVSVQRATSSEYVTPTGQTMPLPGVSKSEGTTALDRGIQQRDDAITSGICRGC